METRRKRRLNQNRKPVPRAHVRCASDALLSRATPDAQDSSRRTSLGSARFGFAVSKNRSQHTWIAATVNDRHDPERPFVRCVRDEIFPHHVKSQWAGGQVRTSVPDVW